jgi:molybdopterin synthase sulfur carrier subunit
MDLKIIVFGKLADIMGNNISVTGINDTDALIKELNEKYPSLIGKKYVIAVDKQIVRTNTLINENSTVALLPPFSGG